MSDKWSKLSIYDVDYKLTDEDGEEHTFTFKPLPWANFPQAYSVLNKLQSSGFFKEQDTDNEEELVEAFFSKMNKDVIEDLAAITKTLVSNSYPDKDEDTVNRFVMANLFQLIGALIQVITRQSKNKRAVDSVTKQ